VENPEIDNAGAAARPSIARAFTPPSPARKSEEASVVVLNPPASVAGGYVVPPVSLPDAVRIPPPPVKDASPPPSKQANIGGNLESANLIKRVPPVYPMLAKSMGVQGTVRFRATIGTDGTVHNIQLVSGNPVLVGAASDAVKKWVYRPTLLNGKPVEVTTQIDVNFSLRK
jgi:protein TonB